MKTSKIDFTKLIAGLSAIGVFLLAIGGFILSYSALHEVALSAGVSSRLAWLWPLLIDLALIIFSLAVLRAYLLKEKPQWPWLLVGFFTLTTITFNIIHSGENVTTLLGVRLSYLIGIVPPVALVLSFETLMGMLRNSVQRQKVIKSIEELENELSKLKEQLGQLTRQIKQARETIGNLNEIINQKREELSRLDVGTIRVYVPDNLTPEIRQQVVSQMVSDELTIGQMAGLLNVSEGTIKNDKRAIVSQNGNGR